MSSLYKLTARSEGELDAFPTSPVKLQAARGEWESFQVVIAANEKPLIAPRIEVSALRSDKHALGAESVRVYRENYVFVSQPSGNRELTPKWWPDALIPLETQELPGVAARRALVLWVCVRVPNGAIAGNYRGEISVASESETRRVPMEVRVENVQLPAPTFRANVAVYYDSLREWYKRAGLTYSELEWAAQKQRYAEFLLDFRLNPYDPPTPWESPQIDAYLRDARVHSVRMPPIESREFPLALQALKKAKTLGKAYSYQIDEPQPEQYKDVRDLRQKLHQTAPQIKLLVTSAPNRGLENAVDIWCPNIGDYFALGHLDFKALQRERARGRETWLYTMVEPRAPYPTWLIDDDAGSVRVYGALWARFGFNGFVYSMAHGWGPQPLQSPRTFADTWGDGLLLYPSELVNDSTSAARTGPMPSIRLMLLRDAIEDYELLRRLPPEVGMRESTLLTGVAPGFVGLLNGVSDKKTMYASPAADLWKFVRGEMFEALRRRSQTPQPWNDPITASIPSSDYAGLLPIIARVQTAPTINGRLNEWTPKTATHTAIPGLFVRFESDTYQPPITKMWAARDAHNLYIALRCETATSDEWCAVEVAPENASERWRFVVTRRGATATEHHTREGRFRVEGADWQGARFDGKTFWNAEFRVPLALVNGENAPFRFNALRRTRTRFNTKVLLRAFPDASDVTMMPLAKRLQNAK